MDDLINTYLHTFFSVEKDFALRCSCSVNDLRTWQNSGVFPLSSYTTERVCSVISFFGRNESRTVNEWYPNGLSDWVGQIRKFGGDTIILKGMFFSRYRKAIEELKQDDIYDRFYDSKVELNGLLEKEWKHFLHGSSGVCTKHCSPEEIATKDVAIRVIDRITDYQNKFKYFISAREMNILAKAVNRLDSVSALFAPHEVEHSSRKQCIDLIRLNYLL